MRRVLHIILFISFFLFHSLKAQVGLDVVAVSGTKYNATKFFPDFTVATSLYYLGTGNPTFSNTTNYYFSYDSILDASDVLLGSKSQNVSATIPIWTQTFTMIPGLFARDYWVFFRHDFLNNVTETNENNNVGCMVLHIDSTFNIPEYKDNFELANTYWKPLGTSNHWKKGYSNVHQTEGSHTGKNSWYIKAPKYTLGPATTHTLESPYMDLTFANNNVICFWYRAKNTYTSTPAKLRVEVSPTFTAGFTSTLSIPFPRFNDWDCNCQSLAALNGKNIAKLRMVYSDATTYAMFNQAVNVDDIFIGQPTPDFTIEHKHILSTLTSLSSDTLYYDFFNAGAAIAPASVTDFYWSNDSLWDAGDILLGSVNEPTVAATGFLQEKFLYTKPTTAQGTYYIVYRTDVTNLVNEMWENNNEGYYKLKQDPLVGLPYVNDFETQANGWWHYASIGTDNWQLGAPTGSVLTSAFSGSVCFNTTQFSNLSPMSRSHLYTPIFDFSTITDPVIEFDMKIHSGQSCHCFEGKMNLSYSTDGGTTWKVLDTVNNSYNKWYYPIQYDNWGGRDQVYTANYTELLTEGTENAFSTFEQYNSRDVDRNTRYIIDINQLAGRPYVQFKFNMGSAKNDTTASAISTATYQGAIIDNFSIRSKFIDLTVPYKKSLMISSLNQNIKFNMHVKNTGNYISARTGNKYYVSADTILDGSDFYLGGDSIMPIRPDMKYYITRIYKGPSSLAAYKYLIYELDSANVVTETNENNNIGYWPLALDSISTYPYFQTFSDTILQGWVEHEKSIFYSGPLQSQWRFRNMVALAEPLGFTQIKSGQMFTDLITSAMPVSWCPTWYLESPSFDFSGHNGLELKFDLAVFGSGGSSSTGGNMQYSLNGGNTWAVLQTTTSSQAYNWYNSTSVSTLGPAPGWTSLIKPVTILDTVGFNINFLSGQPNVVFRYQFSSPAAPSGNGFPQGMRIDNFKIKGNPISTEVKEEIQGFASLYNSGNELYVNYGIINDVSNKYTLTITNMLGQKIFVMPVELERGNNLFVLPDHLGTGMYIVNLVNGKNNLQQKIVVLK